MSAQKTETLPSDFKIEDVRRFFDARTTSAACPFCGKDHWRIVGTVEVDQFLAFPCIPINAVPPNGELLAFSGASIPSLAAICSQCGFVRMHSMMIVSEWLREQDASHG